MIEDEFGNDISTFYKPLGDIIDRLAELEDKIEQGTIIELPCKVGDRVYSLCRGNIYEMKVFDVCTNRFGVTVKAELEDGIIWWNLHDTRLNYDWFFTREKAEKRLKELQNG